MIPRSKALFEYEVWKILFIRGVGKSGREITIVLKCSKTALLKVKWNNLKGKKVGSIWQVLFTKKAISTHEISKRFSKRKKKSQITVCLSLKSNATKFRIGIIVKKIMLENYRNERM